MYDKYYYGVSFSLDKDDLRRKLDKLLDAQKKYLQNIL